MSDRVEFRCNGEAVTLAVEAGESLLSVLRERLGVTSAKDGCAPQGQCGCCTVLVDGTPRVACVTPVARVAGRSVTTLEGLDAGDRARLAEAFVATGGAQCGFCTPGIAMRCFATFGESAGSREAVGRALAGHVCRCTGYESIFAAVEGSANPTGRRDLDAAGRRATLEGGAPQRVTVGVALGAALFADDTAPRDALVAVPLPLGSSADAVHAAGNRWVVGESLFEARAQAAKIQGRRTTIGVRPPIPPVAPPVGGVALATSWVEPAYLEPDASWCHPGGEPASPLGNGGAFGGKATSAAPAAARELADRLGRTVRVVYSREDVVRLGPKRPPVSATAIATGSGASIEGQVATPGLDACRDPLTWPYAIDVHERWDGADLDGPRVSSELRAAGWAERVVLLEGALDEAGVDRAELHRDDRAAATALDVCVRAPSGALAGARVSIDGSTGALGGVDVVVAAGDPLDEVVLRSYAVGAVHMALGWVFTEGLAVDDDGEILDLTMRSFGVIRAKHTPPISVRVLDDPGPPLAAADAVFAATAAAAWNAVARVEGARPVSFPAFDTRAARALRR
ncbi:MAG: 2Fe-2S iron-sulfur cluster-binding protein [Acidimicrobiia bacterium]